MSSVTPIITPPPKKDQAKRQVASNTKPKPAKKKG